MTGGKTWLMRRFRKAAEERAAVATWCDETHADLPAVFGRIAQQCDEQGRPIKGLWYRFQIYQRHCWRAHPSRN